MQDNLNRTNERLFPIDLLKAISITAVVSYHSIFVPVSTYTSNSYLLDVIFAPLRFCVPVLFTISFLLLERGLKSNCGQCSFQLIKKRLIRILIPTLFWVTVAVLIRLITTPFNKITGLLIQGTVFSGAYYLIVLLQVIFVFPWFAKKMNYSKNILIAISINIIFFGVIEFLLLRHSQAIYVLLLRKIGRTLFLYWTSYIVLGILFHRKWVLVVKISKNIPKRIKILALCFTYMIMSAEASWLRLVSGNSFAPFEYAMFSCILSVLVMFLCFASVTEEQFSPFVSQAVKLLSKYSLGIFCINGIISYVFSMFCNYLFQGNIFGIFEILVMKIFGWILLLALSIYISIILERLGLKACVR